MMYGYWMVKVYCMDIDAMCNILYNL